MLPTDAADRYGGTFAIAPAVRRLAQFCGGALPSCVRGTDAGRHEKTPPRGGGGDFENRRL